MSPAEHSSQAKADQAIETIYTTVEAQPDRTDWLTVVSNLRQINRQLVEEIARLEQALASAKQTLHTHKEQNQSHEITILQQQDELRNAHDRIGSLFQQLETSHQIGQRQQTLIETLSQQLEIVQTIVPQIEAEHEQLRHKYQQQSQKLTKTEQVAVELHRRLKLQLTATPSGELLPPAAPNTTAPPVAPHLDDDAISTAPASDEIAPATSFDADSFTQIEPAPPQSQLDVPLRPSTHSVVAVSTAAPSGWREAIFQDREANRYNLTEERGMAASAEIVAKESTQLNHRLAKSSPNWPAPTVSHPAPQDGNSDRVVAKPVKIDLPKFPKRPAK
ncbi:hypothetical protein [Chamaesiphon sp. OTE_8_metabat_110]|uniref:hypothetical protein n=1 Tax=Chamaesiphon sp. OTE_8_metabat_110 TaxID=2964696 RepID=UPI00286AC887|nr:hypothetical protein [Chamaesiphon sp. OTE_8_metabat_110]